MVADERTYRLQPLDASGAFLGLNAAQCALMGAGMLLSVVAISAGLPVPVAGVPLAGAAMVSFARVAGHPVWEWVPLGASWLWAGAGRGRRWTPPLPLWPTDVDRPPPLPPCLAGLDVVEVPWGPDRTLAAVGDRQRHTLTAVVPVTGGSFVTESSREQERQLAAWGDVLSQFASSQGAVSHVTWSATTRPSGLAAHLGWVSELPASGSPRSEALASYGDLLDIAVPNASAHDVVVSVTVAGNKTGRHADDGLGQRLGAAVDALSRGLRSAGLHTDAPLDIAGLHRLLRARTDPTSPPRPGGGRLAARLGLVPATSAGPLVVDTAWRSIRVDRAWHRTWWVASWPRLAVPPSWLEPFISADGITRTMTVTFVPVSTHQSRRRIERDLVKLESDATTKEERGSRVDARHQRATEALLERERELVTGFAEMAYVGLVSVAATSEDELEQHAEIVEQLAHESGMDLRVLDGRQDVAWAAVLPLGLAPRGLLAT